MAYTLPNGISFCVITNGRRQKTIEVALKSIATAGAIGAIPHEIIIAGDIVNLAKSLPIRLKCVEVGNPEVRQRLGALRNLAGKIARFDVLVFADDDIVFPGTWIRRFLEFTSSHKWQVLSNRILLPDGGRYWDRATLRPHRLVHYDHPPADPNLYQTGGFIVMTREAHQRVPWDDEITFYNERQGGQNEDVEFSGRLTASGYERAFDSFNTVWHFDPCYQQVGDGVVRRQTPNREFCSEFSSLLRDLQSSE